MKQLANLNQNQQRFLEPLLIAIVFGVTAVMGYYSVETPVLLHLFYVPVVLTGSLQGKYRARVMALLCILSSLIIFVPHLNKSTDGVPFMTLAVFLLWGGMLVLIAMLVGSLSDGWRSAMAKLTEAHKKDVLTDSLTGVANRRAYEFELARRIADWNRTGNSVSLILLDIDYFKKFNDRYGHQAGDAVLRAVAEELKETVREADLVARYGGEEFAVVLSIPSLDETKETAERIRRIIEASRFKFNGMVLKLTVSVGFAQIGRGENAATFVERADAALYTSKEAGRNCVHYHDGQGCQAYGQGIATEIIHSDEKKDSKSQSDPYTDETTGLPSQKVFLEELRRRTAERHRYGTRLSLALVQFDEELDPAAKDSHVRKSLLATIARLASSVIRDTDLIARYDSDHLGILLPVTDLEHALIPLCRLLEKTSTHTDAKYASLSYSVSIGAIEILPKEHPGSALQRAEAAMKSAHSSGGNCLFVHDGEACLPWEQASLAENFEI